MRKRILVTGGAGFIASHLVDHLLRATDWDVLVLDRFTYAANGFLRLEEIGAVGHPRFCFYVADAARPLGCCLEREIGPVDHIVHMAAETHVDNSIACPRSFVEANVFGTFEMLEYARRVPSLQRFYYFSTDEVFGPAPAGVRFAEWDRYNSCNPYAATKAAGEELVLAWANTYRVPVVISHMMNVFGERQHPEKFIPRVVKSVLSGTELEVHADPVTGRPGSRHYLHARDVASATMFILERGQLREKYNVVGEQEISNLEVAQRVASIIGRPLRYRLVDPATVRPGFDVRYGLSGAKLAALGWVVPQSFNRSLEATVRWMVDPRNAHWLAL